MKDLKEIYLLLKEYKYVKDLSLPLPDVSLG